MIRALQPTTDLEAVIYIVSMLMDCYNFCKTIMMILFSSQIEPRMIA